MHNKQKKSAPVIKETKVATSGHETAKSTKLSSKSKQQKQVAQTERDFRGRIAAGLFDFSKANILKTVTGHKKSNQDKAYPDLMDLLDRLRFSSPEERLKNQFYEKYFSHSISQLQNSFRRSKIPSLCTDFVTWTLQQTSSIKRLEACYKADLLMLRVTKPEVNYRSETFEELLSKSNELHNCMLAL